MIDCLVSAEKYIAQNEYTTVGAFLENISPEELKRWVVLVNRIILQMSTQTEMECLTVLSDMLTRAESGDMDQEISERTGNLMILLSFEDLHRKNVINFDRAKATLSGSLSGVHNLARLR